MYNLSKEMDGKIRAEGKQVTLGFKKVQDDYWALSDSSQLITVKGRSLLSKLKLIDTNHYRSLLDNTVIVDMSCFKQ